MFPINVIFEDEEGEFLKNLKDKLSWHDFILKLANEFIKNEKVS